MVEGKLAPGQALGERYRVVRELGRGGMGVVYLARDERLDMDVAVKLVGIAHGEATLWLKREFRAVSSLRHQNLVELYELGTLGASCYFTMEYLAGIDPRRWIERDDPDLEARMARSADERTATVAPMQEAHTAISAPEVAEAAPAPERAVPVVDFERVRGVIAGLAEGLAFLHGRGVIHRDVKPSNVIVADGVIKLLDFGLALEQRRQDGAFAPEGRIVGTAAYLAPEYLDQLHVSPALDVYALGVLGFELVTGAPPFGGALHVLARRHRELVMPLASARNPHLPPDLGALIDRMLAQDPGARPTAIDIAQALTGSLSQPASQGRRLGFVGRAAPLARLLERLADPVARGRLVLVTGPSGVGKTALVDEAVGRTALTTGMSAWRGRCDERERVPYRAFDQIIDDLAGELFVAPAIARELEHAGALARVFPVLGPMLAPLLGETPLEAPAGDLRVERERALLALIELVRHLVRTARAAIVIDDLQWADDESLELLALLVERIDRPLTVIASWTVDAESGELPPAAQALLERLGPRAEPLPLAAMGDDELLALLAEIAPRAPTARLEAAARLAAGSPYLAELIGRELATADVADPHDAEGRRFARLRPDERAVAEVAAAAGGAATFEALRGVAGLSSARVRSALRGLEDARIVRATPTPAGDSAYAFYHQRLRAAADAGVPPAERREHHARFARGYERDAGGALHAAQLAFHWEHAGDPARAARWAGVAGDAARAQLAWSVAADWYTRALDLGADEPSRVRLARADARFLGGKLAAAADDYLVLAGTVDDALAADRHRVRAAEAYLKLGEIDRALAVLDEVLGRRGVTRAAGRARSLARAATVAARWLAPLPGPARREPVDDVLAAAYRVIASFLSTPHPIEALEYVLRGVALAERSADRAAHSQGMAMVAAYLAAGTLGRFGDRALARAQQLAVESGAPYAEMVAAGCGGILAMLRGDWPGMRASHEAGDRVCLRLGLERSWEASFLRSYAALGELYAGDPARALVMLAELAERADDHFGRALLATYRGRAHLLAGDVESARAIARAQREDPVVDQGMTGVYRRVFGAELALAEHDWRRARALAEELARTARRDWLSMMPAVSAMVDVAAASAELGLAVEGDRAAAGRAAAIARRLRRIGGASFYAVTGLRLEGQALALLGDAAGSRRTLARAADAGRTRGGAVDRLAIAALQGEAIDPGPLAAAVAWSTGGAVTV